jgi:predicted RecA/RadA family phage recombinase
MKNFIARGQVIDVVLAAGVLSGGVVKVGSMIGIANTDGSTGDTIAVSFEGAYGSVPKATGTAWTQGDPLFWDAGAGKLTKVAPGNTFAGYAYADALSADTTGSVVLEGAGDNPDSAQAAVVAAIATADGSDAGTTQTLANATKTTVNAILTSLKAAGIMATS